MSLVIGNTFVFVSYDIDYVNLWLCIYLLVSYDIDYVNFCLYFYWLISYDIDYICQPLFIYLLLFRKVFILSYVSYDIDNANLCYLLYLNLYMIYPSMAYILILLFITWTCCIFPKAIPSKVLLYPRFGISSWWRESCCKNA